MLVLIGCVASTACVAPPRTLYAWDGYQAAVYQYLKSNGNETGNQISELEAQIVRNESAGLASPPGMHGHLALLYARAGDDASAARHLEIERRLFPEAAAYIEFLLRSAAKSGAKS